MHPSIFPTLQPIAHGYPLLYSTLLPSSGGHPCAIKNTELSVSTRWWHSMVVTSGIDVLLLCSYSMYLLYVRSLIPILCYPGANYCSRQTLEYRKYHTSDLPISNRKVCGIVIVILILIVKANKLRYFWESFFIYWKYKNKKVICKKKTFSEKIYMYILYIRINTLRFIKFF